MEKVLLGLNEDGINIERTTYGFIDIEAKMLDIQTAVEDVMIDFYLNYEDAKHISLEISNIIIIFDRFDNPQSPVFQVIGRKYSAGSDVFLMPSISLGEISTEEWKDYVSFYSYIFPYMESWIDILNKYNI